MAKMINFTKKELMRECQNHQDHQVEAEVLLITAMLCAMRFQAV
ncbi:hypothetical protein [Bacillus thuringiensis]|nr:hypothetical protein [Bacillus thuringiensis]MED3051691.1 hypothetical protein [Bacillus thuringiensis]